MKINDAEKLLGITKANLRFYEKEGLITPERTENGYRNYSENDVTQLKNIIILRKLGIPVQKIGDILDGAVPFQSALEENILFLQDEIDKLNGSLELCRQLKQEAAEAIDTERYWNILHDKEQEGYRFQTLLHDYIAYIGNVYTHSPNHFWFLWQADRKKPLAILARISGAIVLSGGFLMLAHPMTFPAAVRKTLLSFLFLAAVFFMIHIPVYFISRKNPELGKAVKIYGILSFAFLGFGIICYILWKSTGGT